MNLGNDVWCEARREPVSERVNLLLADSIGLARVLGSEQLGAALLDWMDEDDVPPTRRSRIGLVSRAGERSAAKRESCRVADLGRVRGFEAVSEADLERFFTVRGDGRIDPNLAPLQVLRGLSVLPEGGAERVVRARSTGFGSRVPKTSPTSPAPTGPWNPHSRLVRRTVFDSNQHILRLTGVARSSTGRVRRHTDWAHVTVISGRVAIRRLEVGP